MCISGINVYAGDNDIEEQYQLIEENFEVNEEEVPNIIPYSQYLIDVQTTIAKISAGKVGIRAHVYCSSVVQDIKITFMLQKKSGSTWKTVATTTASASNVTDAARSVTASGVSSGTYRGKAIAMVTDKYGYSETLSSFSGSIQM